MIPMQTPLIAGEIPYPGSRPPATGFRKPVSGVMSPEDLRKYLVFKDTEFGCGEGWEAILDDLGLDHSRLASRGGSR